MAWGLGNWLGLARCVQILTSLVASGLHGFLFGYLSINKLGLAKNVIVLQFIITAWFAFVVIAFTLVHTKGRSRQTPWLVAAIVGDVVFIWAGLALVTILSHAGLPVHCAGLTKSTYSENDAVRKPAKGYTSIRFTNQWNGEKGEIDHYCALDRAFYGATLVLITANIISIILAILRICQGAYVKRAKANIQASELVLNALREEEKRRLEPYSHNSAASRTSDANLAALPAAACHAVPSSEGATSARTPHLGHQYQRFHPQQQQQQQQQQPLLSPLSPTSPTYWSPTDAAASTPTAAAPTTTALNGYETPEEEAAAAALIADGSSGRTRDLECGLGSSAAALPPYTPGRLNPMSGHGNESNEMRLSGYVKGETRAQHMKDGFS